MRRSDAALLIPALFFGLTLLVVFLLCREACDNSVGVLAVGLLLNYYPLRHVAAAAWSESTGIFFVVCALWLMAKWRYTNHSRRAFVIEILSGLAFATRYSLGLIVVVACVAVGTSLATARALRLVPAVVGGFLCASGPVLLRNLYLTGHITGEPANPGGRPILINITNTTNALCEYYERFYIQPPLTPLELRKWAAVISVCASAARQAYRAERAKAA